MHDCIFGCVSVSKKVNEHCEHSQPIYAVCNQLKRLESSVEWFKHRINIKSENQFFSKKTKLNKKKTSIKFHWNDKKNNVHKLIKDKWCIINSKSKREKNTPNNINKI